MTALDWFIVIAANGAIVAYGLRLAKDTHSAFDWFLAAKGLPWWIVGLSMFATAVDSGDYVAVVGGAYGFGLQNLASWWLGIPTGWFIVSFFVFVPLYRAGMYTNAEYLEYRFGPAVRVLSALIQLQYRTNVLGNIAVSLYLLFSILTGWGQSTWWMVVGIAAAAAAYTAAGGLKSVALTDAMQSVIMLAASAVLWIVLWNHVGGWVGLETRLTELSPALAESMLRIGGRTEPGVPPWMIILGWVIFLTAYCVVNHSQSMRLLAARSEWDMRTAAFLASLLTAIVMWFNISMGVLGRAVFPGLVRADAVYPLLVQEFLRPGLLGLVVAGVLAGGISTYDSIGSSLSAVFTRDIYARFLARGRTEEHYLWVSRWMTPAVIAVSFLYIPFLESGMVAFALRITSVAVVPLMVVTVMGALTRVPRAAGGIGLLVGITYGLSSLAGSFLDLPLPYWWTNTWWAYLWSVGFTAGAMVATAAVRGWAPADQLSGLLYRPASHELDTEASQAREWSAGTKAPDVAATLHPFSRYPARLPLWLRPAVFAVLLMVALVWLTLFFLW